MDEKVNKKGQMTIWIIVAVFIVGAVLIFILLRGNRVSPVSGNSDVTDPGAFIQTCTRQAIEEATDIAIPQGGFIEPRNYKLYENKKVEYICENIGSYYTCIMQHPRLLTEVNNEIQNYITPVVENCFVNLKAELEKRNYKVEMGNMNLTTQLVPGIVSAEIKRKIVLSKGDQTQKFEEFSVRDINPIYDLTSLAIEIASQEAKYCYFEYVGYMILYPNVQINKFTMSDSTKIYNIKDTKSQKQMNIAIRSCAIPAGF